MNPLRLPMEYYKQEGFLSLMGLGYTFALAVTGLGLVNLVSKRERYSPMSSETLIPQLYIVSGGALATWGYLKAAGVDY